MTRQANYFKAAMADWNEVLEGTEVAMNASGSATERMAIYADSLQGKLNSLQDSWDEFVIGMGSSEVIKTVVDMLTSLLNILDFLLNDIPLVSDAIKTILVAEGINILIGALKQLKTFFGKSGLSIGGIIDFKEFASGFKQTADVIKEVGTVSAASSVEVTGLSASFGKLSASAIAFIASNPAVAVAALTTAVIAGIAAFAIYNNSLTAAEKRYDKLSEKAENSQAEVDSVNSELDSVDQQISEINEKGTLTLTDKEELKNLQEQRKELELILAAKEKTAEIDAKKEADEAKKIVDKKYGDSNFTTEQNKTGGGSYKELSYAAGGASLFNDWDAILESYDALERKKQQGIALTEKEQEQYEKLDSILTTELNDAQGYLDSIEASGDTTSEAYQKAYSVVEALQSRLTPEEWKSVKLSDLIDTNSAIQSVQETINQLKEQFSNGLIDEETYNQKLKDAIYGLANNSEIQQAIKNIFGNNVTTDEIANTLAEQLGVAISEAADNIDISSFDNLKSKIENELSDLDIDFNVDTSNLEDVLDNLGDTTNLNDLGSALDEIGNSIENYKSEISSLSDIYNSLGANVDNAVSMLDAIGENMDALTGQTQLNGEETQKLIDKFSSLGPVIDVSTGEAYNGMDLLNQTVLNTGASAGDMQNSVQSFMGGVTNAGNNTITAMNYVLDAIVKVKQALASALNTASSFVSKASSTINKIGNSVGGSLVSKFFGISSEDITSATQSLNNVAQSLKNEAQSVTNSIKTEQAMLIQQTQQYQAKLQNAGKAGKKAYNDSITKGASGAKKATDEATDATEDLIDALKEQYEAEKAILDQQKEALENQKELLNEEKEGLEDAQDAINNLIDMTMDMLKQKYEDEIEELDKQKEAIDEQVDAFEEKIEKQKEILDLQRQEEEHQDELAEKNKAIADIQAELAEIQFDNSAEGQKRRLELLEQLNSAQKDLSDYESDYDYETKNDALDKELDAFKQMMDAKKELIDQQEDYIRDNMMTDYNLYMEAIKLIEGKSDEFYNQLIEWNKVYGTHLDIDVKQAWDRCYKALDEYGYLGVGVQGILTGITERTAEIEEQNKIIENSIKSIENELDILKKKYDAATAAAKQQAAASKEAEAAANAAAAASNAAAAAAQNAANAQKNNVMGGGSGGVHKEQSVKLYHSGTDYVKKANSWLDDMLGLKPNETAAILKVGEAVIPDYANPFAASSNNNNLSVSKTPVATGSVSNQENSINIKIGDIVVHGDADENTVMRLKKEKENIVQELFKRINKHTILNGYKNVRFSN